MKNVTIGFLSRERFSFAATSLQSIVDCTKIPFNLIVINNDIPNVYWEPVEQIINKLDNVKVINTEQLITANHARNLVVQESQDEFICLIENDIKVKEGWLSHLIDACEALSADVAIPLILEFFDSQEIVHFDTKLGHIEQVKEENGEALKVFKRKGSPENDRTAERRITEFIELHGVLFRKSVFDRIGLFDGKLRGPRNIIDISLALYKAGIKVVFEPQSVITFFPPPPLYPEEKAFFEFIWDVDAATKEEESLIKKWNLVGFPTAIDFAESRLEISKEPDPEKQIDPLKAFMDSRKETIEQAARDLSHCIPAGESLILVDDMQWGNEGITSGFKSLPFLEKDGEYWGNPENDETAIRELQRMRTAGEKYIVFGKPAFWWLDYYHEFSSYLRSNFKTLLDNDRVVVFDLREKVS